MVQGRLVVRRPLRHAGQAFAFLAWRSFGFVGTWWRRSIESAFGMDMADEVDVGGQVGQDALAAVGAVAGDEDLVVGKPGGDREISSTASWGRVRWLGSGLGLVLALFFFPLVRPWRLRYSRVGDGQGRRPWWVPRRDGR